MIKLCLKFSETVEDKDTHRLWRKELEEKLKCQPKNLDILERIQDWKRSTNQRNNERIPSFLLWRKINV